MTWLSYLRTGRGPASGRLLVAAATCSGDIASAARENATRTGFPRGRSTGETGKPFGHFDANPEKAPFSRCLDTDVAGLPALTITRKSVITSLARELLRSPALT